MDLFNPNPNPNPDLNAQVWVLKYWAFDGGFWVWEQSSETIQANGVTAVWPAGRALHSATIHSTTLLVWGGRLAVLPTL